MAKVMNVVFGIGVAVILYLVVLFGVHAFYPEPKYEDYCENPPRPEPIEYTECSGLYQEADEEYGKNIFFITSTIGTIIVITSFFLLGMVNISAGVALAGLALIVYGFARGWRSTGELPNFLMGIIVATIVIYFAVKINRKLK